MKTLLLLRHAKSSWDAANVTDHDRPLNDRGKRDAPRMGRLIKQNDLTPDLILVSTAKRARKTATTVAQHCGDEVELKKKHKLYEAPSAAFVSILREVPDHRQRVLIVAHNPGIEQFLEDLTGRFETMPTAALAQITLGIDSWRDIQPCGMSKLAGVWRPRGLETVG